MNKIPLRQLIQEYIGGGWGKEKLDEEHSVLAHVIRGTDLDVVQSGSINGVPRRWHKANNVRSRALCPGDIVFEVSGGSKDQPVGRSLLLDSANLEQFQSAVIPASFCKKITPDQRMINPRFLLAHLQLAWADRRIIQWQVQSTGISNFNFEAFLDDFMVPLPRLSIQQDIAGILSAYDELIYNSQRRIKILESMSRALYREWFLYFRFPEHESVPLVPSILGHIPEGWEVEKLVKVAEVNQSQINARNAPRELHYIDISSVSPGQIDRLITYSFAEAPGRARRIVKHGDVLWSCVRPNRCSHAQVMHPETNTIASTGFAVLTATKVPFTFLYFATTTDDFVAYLSNNATGSAYPAVSATTFENADLLIPPAPLLKKFGAATVPMAEEIHALQLQIKILRITRDALLPRLLSGQIDMGAVA